MGFVKREEYDKLVARVTSLEKKTDKKAAAKPAAKTAKQAATKPVSKSTKKASK
jgi:BMFP domain-containing protein YqiC